MNRLWIGAAFLALAGCSAEHREKDLGTEPPSPVLEDETMYASRAQQGAPMDPGAQGPGTAPTTQAPTTQAPTTQEPSTVAPGAQPTTGTTASADVSRVLAAIAAVDQNQIDAAKTAQKQASSPEVKEFATRVLADRQADEDSLKKLSQNKKIDFGQAKNDPILKAHETASKDSLDKLKNQKGTAFDASYIEAQTAGSSLLANLADQGRRVSKDNDVDALLGSLQSRARDAENRAVAIGPKACAPPPTTKPRPTHGGTTEPTPGGAAPQPPTTNPDQNPSPTTPPERTF